MSAKRYWWLQCLFAEGALAAVQLYSYWGCQLVLLGGAAEWQHEPVISTWSRAITLPEQPGVLLQVAARLLFAWLQRLAAHCRCSCCAHQLAPQSHQLRTSACAAVSLRRTSACAAFVHLVCDPVIMYPRCELGLLVPYWLGTLGSSHRLHLLFYTRSPVLALSD